MESRLRSWLLAAAMVVLSPVAHSSNMGFLEFSPSAYFTEQDWTLLREAANNLLDNHKIGESVSWENKENNHNGTLTLLKSYQGYGTTCRTMEVKSDAIEVKTTRVVDMCKNKEGQWKVLN